MSQEHPLPPSDVEHCTMFISSDADSLSLRNYQDNTALNRKLQQGWFVFSVHPLRMLENNRAEKSNSAVFVVLQRRKDTTIEEKF